MTRSSVFWYDLRSVREKVFGQITQVAMQSAHGDTTSNVLARVPRD